MHIRKLLHKTFKHASKFIDKRNHKTLIEAVLTLCECKHLSIAAIGRNLKSKALIKNNIKRIDRLFGNANTQNAAIHYYRIMTVLTIKNNKRPTISVDWSGLTPCGEFHFLRASCPVQGRAMTVFEKSYRESEYMKQSTHRAFIKIIKQILPSDCNPIIVTDAGFRGPWFKLVSSCGWDFVGRLRNNTHFKTSLTKNWLPIKTLYVQAKRKPQYLFKAILAKANPVQGYFHLIKSRPKKRTRKNLRGKKIQSSVSLKHAKRGNEPWLIFTSLSSCEYNAKRVMKMYAQRMQIEEAFRDLKNTNNGLSLRHCRSYQKGRLNIALLIAAITHFFLWLVGLIARQNDEHLTYQANTVKNRNVLSTFSIGWQYLKRHGTNISSVHFKLAIRQINKDFLSCL